ncbi:MAG: ABC transporter substrate-binding protein [Betaproteobacteria bacterium]|nr:ABC transporter substrate-binding protein [Betaproteobacteria bacterium]
MRLIARLLIALIIALPVSAKTLRFATQNDATTLDPHAANLLPNARITQNVYEGLVARDADFNIVPSLALSWSQPDAKTWRFKLRPGVTFHDGSAFTADDVVFSVERSLHPLSQLKFTLQGVQSARRVDDLTVDLVMKEPNPVLLNHLYFMRIMSRQWCTKHGVLAPQNYRDNEDTFAARNANGTGPFKVELRQPDVKTVLRENRQWWNRASPSRGNVSEVIWLPMKSNATRIAALLSGEVDFVVDPPVQDVARLKKSPNLKIVQSAEARIHYLGFDLSHDNLQYGPKSGNPFKDLRVRQAVVHAIDVNAIRDKVFRGFTIPTGSLIAPQVHGYVKELDTRLPLDRAKAKRLLAEAGYPQGFDITLDCLNTAPNSELCQAIAPMLTSVGIRVNANLMPITTFIPKVQKADTSFFWYSWGAVTFDALYTLQGLLHTYSGDQSGNGDSNLGRYSNPALDALIAKIKVEPDKVVRDRLIRDALEVVVRELPVVVLHQPVIPWAMRATVEIGASPNNIPAFDRFRMR